MHDIQIGAFDMSPLAESFDRLPEDTYTPLHYRFRRLSEVTTTWKDGKCFYGNSDGSIIQASEINGFLGDVTRHYPAIEDEVFGTECFHGMMRKFQDLTGWKGNFHVHQIRIKAIPGILTMPAPEGPHSDGYTWTVPFVLGRTNITGGEFSIMDKNRNVIIKGDMSHNYALFNDKELLHYADPIQLIDESKPGHWDTFVFTTND